MRIKTNVRARVLFEVERDMLPLDLVKTTM